MRRQTSSYGVAILSGLALTTVSAAGKPATQSAETQSAKPDWAKFDWVQLNVRALAEYTRPVRPGIPGKSPFLNVRCGHNQGHMYAPNFEFGAEPEAKHYRFTVAHWDADKKIQGEKTYSRLRTRGLRWRRSGRSCPCA